MHQALRILDLIDDTGAPGLEFRRLVDQGGTVLGDALRRLYPSLISAIERGAPPEEVANLFGDFPQSDWTRNRFRTFVLSALQQEGTETGSYRRQRVRGTAQHHVMPKASLPTRASPPDQHMRDPEPHAEGASLQPDESLSVVARMATRHELSLIASQERAWDRGDVATAEALGKALADLRREVSERQGVEGPT